MKFIEIRKLNYIRSNIRHSKGYHINLNDWVRNPYSSIKSKLFIEISSVIVFVLQKTFISPNFLTIFNSFLVLIAGCFVAFADNDFKLIGRGARTSFEFLNVIDQASYQVRARGVNIYGVKSSSITANRTIIGLVAPPSDVNNFSCNIVGDDAHLSWNPVPDLDLAFYVVNFSTAI